MNENDRIGTVPILRSTRLDLRELGPDDAAFMLALLNDADFVRNVGDRGVRTLEDARRYIVDGPMASYARDGFGFWAVLEQGQSEPIGICGLARRPILPDVDIGYAFLPAARGRGLALEAARVVFEHARGTLGLRRIIAITALDNPSSSRLLEKLGLRFERCLRLGSESHDVRIYAWQAEA